MAGTRQLAAIMCTDIDGYAALIQQDESTAVEFKERHREVLHRLADKFHGKILQNIGHDSLSLFSSAVEAVECAIEMQHEFRERIPVPVRIGIHLGDIIITGEEAIGDGLMLARRIEAQSLPGGILISSKIHEEVKRQRGIESRYLKKCELDEQDQQVEVYAVTNEGLAIPENLSSGYHPGKVEVKSKSGLRNIWEEAKRRNVIRVVVMYAGAAYVVTELVNNITDPLGLPRWLPTVVILLLIVGFPITAILSWIFDLTPEGIKRTKPAVELEAVEPDTHADSNVNWFKRNKVLRRYLLPFFVVVFIGCFYFFKDEIFQNWERVNRVAREHTERANLYLNNRADPALIKQELDLALEADADYDSALYTYAMIHRMEGDTVLAKQKLHMVLESDPGYSNAWDQLATFAFKQDSFDKAMGYSIMAMESNPGNFIAAYNLAIQSEDRGYFDQAIAYFKRATQMDSAFTQGYSALGSLYNKMNRPTDAIFTLRKSLRISPASTYNFMVYKNLAEAHFLLKEYEKALDYLEQSKSLNPNFAETEKCFARYYEATDDPEASILHWRRYLALETDSLKLLETEAHLDSLRLNSLK